MRIGGDAKAGEGRRARARRKARPSSSSKPASSARSITRSSKPSRADDLFQWLKDNKYSYSGDEATLNFYVQKKWLFTVMKIDTMQMKKNKDGSFAGEVTPTRFQFASDKLVYPLKITQISVKDKTEALFYVQAPHKVDLQGDMTLPVHLGADAAGGQRLHARAGLPGRGDDWLKAIKGQIPDLLQTARQLGFNFQPGQRPQPNKQGPHPDHDGMGPQADRRRHQGPHGRSALQREGARCR